MFVQSERGSTTRARVRNRDRVKLRAISTSSVSSARRPSETLMRQNGVRIITWTNMTEKLEMSSQM